MQKVIIDNELCTGCGTCVSACFYGIIQKSDDDYPAAIPELLPYCSRCGHCEAACPEAAISVEYPGAASIPDCSGEINISPREIGSLMTMRRSVRHFTKKPVSKEQLEEILKIVRYAPTGMNGQSVHWLILTDPAEINKLAGLIIDWGREVVKNQPDFPLAPILSNLIAKWDEGIDPICHSAPCLAIAYGQKENPLSFIDSVIAMTHLDLAAPVFGLGTCWAGFVQIAADASPQVAEFLRLPEGFKSQYAMMIGHPAGKFYNIPKRDSLKVLWR
ncbi:MAG: nitroreductase family protein [Methanomicrobiaceae archaeon]|nr:nitroreductase family protein [Methanomicrobiaceae archaeon]